MTFVIFHGSFGTPESNWFPYLKNELEALGHRVSIPSFPVDDWNEVTRCGPTSAPKKQSLSSWVTAFDEIYPTFSKDEQFCFIGHSLGSLFMLHIAEKYQVQLKGAIFVSPFLETLHKSWQIDMVNKSFYRTNFNFTNLKKFIPVSYALYGDNDPYVDEKYAVDFSNKMGSACMKIPNGGHLNAESGYTTFPLLVDLCKKIIKL